MDTSPQDKLNNVVMSKPTIPAKRRKPSRSEERFLQPPATTSTRAGVCTCLKPLVLFLIAIPLVLLGVLGPDRIVYDILLPYVPGELMLNAGSLAMTGFCFVNRFQKRIAPSTFEECDDPEEEKTGNHPLRVVVAVNKGGSVLGARLSGDLAQACGQCMALGTSTETRWPPIPDHFPFMHHSDADIMTAIPMGAEWESYSTQNKTRTVRCVVLTRNPHARFKSLFQYAYEGGEYPLWAISKEMKAIGTWKERLHYAWNKFGKDSMKVTHAILKSSIASPHCLQIKFEDIAKDYDNSIAMWLKQWNMNPSAIPKLLRLAARHDLKRLNSEERKKHNHISGNTLTQQDIDEIKAALASFSEMNQFLQAQALELHYE